jgi:formylglycine-generating enzyme required for sulfatase activity
VNCLGCQDEIAIWDNGCGACGAQQAPLVDKALANLKDAHDQAERFLIDLEFDVAAEHCELVASESDSRLQQYSDWHEEFSTRLECSRISEHSRLSQLLQEALTHEQAYDYKSALQTLTQVAPSLKETSVLPFTGDTAKEISERLITKESRLKELEATVRDRVTKREITGLLPIVNELLTLKPDRPEVQKLKEQLEKRDADLLEARDAAVNKATQQLGEQQYAETLATLNTVSEKVSSEQLEELKTKASDLLNQLNSLRDQIKKAISDNQFVYLLPVVEQCLVLKSDQDEIIKLKQDLIARETQLDARNQQVILQVTKHMRQYQFAEALQILSTIEPKYQTSSTVALSQKAEAELLARAPITNTIGMTLNKIPAGTFTMGSPEGEEGRKDNETQHPVTISKAFYMQTTEVTQGQWKAVMGTVPWKGVSFVKEGPNYAATYVSWNDAVAYCEKLSEKESVTYRLPTEAEWEYACRAGTETAWSFGDDDASVGQYAWYRGNAYDIGERYAHQVRLKKPNAFGLYDMQGNAHEWCHDFYGKDYYKQSPEQDPAGPLSGSSRVLRGGSWLNVTRFSRSARRFGGDADGRDSNGGFRLVRELD